MKATESPTDTNALNVLTFLATSTGRRTALANWLTDRKNLPHGSALRSTIFDATLRQAARSDGLRLRPEGDRADPS